MITPDREALEWLGKSTRIAPDDIELAEMKGSTSSSLFLVRSTRDADPSRFVLRLLDNPTWLAEEPDLAQHEITALGEVATAGLPGPLPVAHIRDASPFGAPVVLMSFIEGVVDLQPSEPSTWLDGIARELARIHRHTAAGFAWHYRSWVDKSSLTPPGWTSVPDLWQRAIDLARAGEPESRNVFIHRDYHPTNILWVNGAVSGVVDWINACRGPAGVDVAHCRTNLARMYGPEVADRFLVHYRSADPGYRHEPYFDVDSILDVTGSAMGFYAPWQEFGLGIIPDDLLASRIEEHLANVMARL